MLKNGDILMLEPNTPTTLSPYSPNIVLGVQTDVSLFSGILKPGQYFFCDSTQDIRKNYRQLAELLSELCHAYYTEDNQHQILSLLFHLADIMKQNFVQERDESPNAAELQLTERIHIIRQYLQDNYYQPVYLDMLADKMFLTPQYLSKFIKKHLGTTFSHYLNQIRLEHAYEELIYTDHSITDIALNNGFPNVGALNRSFRDAYDMSPSAYRNQNRQQEDAEADRLHLKDIPAIAGSAIPIRTIGTALGSLTPCPKPWCDTINIGSLTDAMNISFHDSFLEYQKYIPIKYVRFSHIFSEEIIYQDETTGEFNFTTLDEILRFFQDAGVIPHIELSYKPLFASPDIRFQTPRYWKTTSHSEQDLSYYKKLFRELLRHCIQQFGRAYVSRWRFEVWLKQEDPMTSPEDLEDYFLRYTTYYEIIQELAPDCAVGGPGFNMCGFLNDFREFISQAEKRGIHFDFISLYGFIYETQNFISRGLKDRQGIIASNPNFIKDSFLNYRNYLWSTSYKDTPIYITEIGSTVSLKNFIPDTVFQAAYLCHNMLSLMSLCPVISWLGFWDQNNDTQIPTSINYPSASLVASNGIPKPALFGYSFLARLGKNLVSSGDSYIMTCNSPNRFQLLFYHYTHFNNSFCLNSWETIPMEQSYELFNQEETEHIQFSCENFPEGRYKVVHHTLNRTYGSVLDRHPRTLENHDTTAQELLLTMLNLKDEESLYYRQTTLPRQDIFFVNCENALKLDVTLEPHEVVFYEFSRIY